MKTYKYIAKVILAAGLALSSATGAFAVDSSSSASGSRFPADPDKEARRYYEIGQTLSQKGKYGRAASMFNRAVSYKPYF